LKYTPPISQGFMGFSCPPLAHHKPIANNQRLKDFIEVLWDRHETQVILAILMD